MNSHLSCLILLIFIVIMHFINPCISSLSKSQLILNSEKVFTTRVNTDTATAERDTFLSLSSADKGRIIYLFIYLMFMEERLMTPAAWG